jgi:hypothetical protein
MARFYYSGGKGRKGLGRPEIQLDTHRPKGSPQPREAMSQEAQLESVHGHGTKKDVKRGMEFKDGRAEQEMWGEWNDSDSDRDIEERVQMLLDSDSDLWNYDLHAEVSNGVVHVTGVVDVEEEKEKLRQLLNIEGVRQLDLGVAVNSQVSNLEPKEKALDYEEDRNRLTSESDDAAVFHSQVRNDFEFSD